MATNKNTRNTKNTRNNSKGFIPVDIVHGDDVWTLHYRENEYGLFGLEHNGAVIYGCKLHTSRDGHDFVSFPSRKGSDGKYYAHARFTDQIPDDVVEAIADAIGQ